MLLLLAGLWGSGLSWAGMLLIQKNSSGTIIHWACEDGLFRMGTDDFYTIMDANQQVTYTVMVKERQYTVTTVEDTRRQMEEMQKQMEQMQSSIKALNQKFKGLGKLFGKNEPEPEEGPPPEPKISYKATEETTKIAGYKARKVIELQDGRPMAELWLSEALARDVSRACNYAKLEKMIKAMLPEGKTLANSQQGSPQGGTIIKEGKIFGFPVKTVDLEESQITQVIKVEKKKFPRYYFQVPTGFKRVSFYPGGPIPEKPF